MARGQEPLCPVNPCSLSQGQAATHLSWERVIPCISSPRKMLGVVQGECAFPDTPFKGQSLLPRFAPLVWEASGTCSKGTEKSGSEGAQPWGHSPGSAVPPQHAACPFLRGHCAASVGGSSPFQQHRGAGGSCHSPVRGPLGQLLQPRARLQMTKAPVGCWPQPGEARGPHQPGEPIPKPWPTETGDHACLLPRATQL